MVPLEAAGTRMPASAAKFTGRGGERMERKDLIHARALPLVVNLRGHSALFPLSPFPGPGFSVQQ